LFNFDEDELWLSSNLKRSDGGDILVIRLVLDNSEAINSVQHSALFLDYSPSTTANREDNLLLALADSRKPKV
jgi:hypothetical protein